MRNARTNASAEERYEVGLDIGAALAQDPATKDLSDVVAAANTTLLGSMRAVQKAEDDLRGPRVGVRFAEYSLEDAIRTAFKYIEIADKTRAGPIARAVLPNGLTAVVAPSGEAQRTATEAFIGRLEKCNVPGVDAVRTEIVPRLKQACTDYAAALAARADAMKGLAEARLVEAAAKLDHARTIDKIMGEVRALFPYDRKRQDLYFPAPVSARGGSADEPEETLPSVQPK